MFCQVEIYFMWSHVVISPHISSVLLTKGPGPTRGPQQTSKGTAGLFKNVYSKIISYYQCIKIIKIKIEYLISVLKLFFKND